MNEAKVKREHLVSPHDLPLHCPPQGSSLWNMHPKVFLPIEEQGQATCPYCGAHYVLDVSDHA